MGEDTEKLEKKQTKNLEDKFYSLFLALLAYKLSERLGILGVFLELISAETII